jgi:hypothetical protein
MLPVLHLLIDHTLIPLYFPLLNGLHSLLNLHPLIHYSLLQFLPHLIEGGFGV